MFAENMYTDDEFVQQLSNKFIVSEKNLVIETLEHLVNLKGRRQSWQQRDRRRGRKRNTMSMTGWEHWQASGSGIQ